MQLLLLPRRRKLEINPFFLGTRYEHIIPALHRKGVFGLCALMQFSSFGNFAFAARANSGLFVYFVWSFTNT